MKVVILAAGGSLYGSVDETLPKCLIEISGKTILERQLEILEKCCINRSDVYIVIGGRGNIWNYRNKEKVKNLRTKLIINNQNLIRSQNYSFWLGIKDIKDDVLCMDGDLLINEASIQKVLNTDYPSALLTTCEDSFAKGIKVLLKGNRVLGVGPNIESNRVYRGIAKFSQDFLFEMKKEIQKGDYWDSFLDVLIYKLCLNNFIYNVELDTGNNEIAFLNGGSYAITKEIKPDYILNSKNNNSGKIVRKEATEGRQKLVNEINWILNLPEDTKKYFPSIIKYNLNSDPVYVEMEKYPMKSLRRSLMDGDIGAEKALEILKNIFDFAFEKLYTKNIKETPEKIFEDIYFKRVEDRLIDASKKAKIFSDIVNAENVIINGRRIPNMRKLLSTLKNNKQFIKSVTPPVIRLVHGDLHLDNILVDKNDPSNFVLIDPRGKMYNDLVEGDYAYDLGKIWHSLSGLYDFLHEGQFTLDFSIQGKDLLSEFRITPHPALAEYKKIFMKLPDLLYNYDIIKKDPYWSTRTMFNEVIHFCSMAPFHVRGLEKEDRAIAMYLRGMMLLDKFLNELEFNSLVPTLINVNTVQDYLRANRLFKSSESK